MFGDGYRGLISPQQPARDRLQQALVTSSTVTGPRDHAHCAAVAVLLASGQEIPPWKRATPTG